MNHKKKRFNKKKKRQRKRAILAIRILIVIAVFVGVKFIPKRENQNLQMENNRTSDSEQSNNTEETENKEEIETPKLDNSGYTSFEEDPNADDAAVVAANTKGLLNRTKTYPVRTDGKKVVYLTFDDGPDEKYTAKLLDLLKKHNIKATFFVVASFARNNPQIIDRMKKENHCIGLHSFEHKNALFQSRGYTKYDFEESIKIMNDLGVNFKFYRPPWGHCNIFTSREIKKHNLKKVLWDVMAQDWQGNTTVEAITDKLLLRSKENSIICLHDGRGENEAPSRTIKALQKAIPIWKINGYKFATMEDYYEEKSIT